MQWQGTKHRLESRLMGRLCCLQNQSFQPASMKKEPPRLVVTAGDVDDVASYSSFVLCDGIVLQVGSSTIQDMVLGLLHCYYAWGLTYPKDFQVLPFVQEHVLNDCEQMFKSAAYIKFNMKFRDTKWKTIRHDYKISVLFVFIVAHHL